MEPNHGVTGKKPEPQDSKAWRFVVRLLAWAEGNPPQALLYREVRDPFQKLCLSILLQRARPRQAEEACRRLFSVLPTVRDVAEAPKELIAELVRPAGMQNLRAERLKALANALIQEYGGKIPENREELLRLPGVGEYAADLTLCWVFGWDVVVIDSNVLRILRRVGLIRRDGEARRVLERIIPKGLRKSFNFILINFGGQVCRPVRPRCRECVLRDLCDHFNVEVRGVSPLSPAHP